MTKNSTQPIHLINPKSRASEDAFEEPKKPDVSVLIGTGILMSTTCFFALGSLGAFLTGLAFYGIEAMGPTLASFVGSAGLLRKYKAQKKRYEAYLRERSTELVRIVNLHSEG